MEGVEANPIKNSWFGCQSTGTSNVQYWEQEEIVGISRVLSESISQEFKGVHLISHVDTELCDSLAGELRTH